MSPAHKFMMLQRHHRLLLALVSLICLVCNVNPTPALHPNEVEALKDITATLGVKYLNLSVDPCLIKTLVITKNVLMNGENSTIRCNCLFNNNRTCHITHFVLKTFSLPGKLPPELVKLKHLEAIDLCLNYLSGSIPMEWASLPNLKSISVCANRLSGDIPPGLGKFPSLKYLCLEANQFSGTIPEELGNLVNMEALQFSSNKFVGSIPATLGNLTKLKDFRLSDNRLNGSIPEFIGDWSLLQRLHLYASGLKGPIPNSISRLENLKDMRISDTSGGFGHVPDISSKSLQYLVLRNLNLSGPIPLSVWELPSLMTLDLSFNRLSGEIPTDTRAPKYTYLTGNMLSGDIESGVFLTSSTNIDLSYNNFTWSSSCKERTKERTNVNTYKSSYARDRTQLLPCSKTNYCNNYTRSVHINCGGDDVTITKARGYIVYQGDNYEPTSSATNYHGNNWGFSNTGDFMDDGKTEDIYSVSSDILVSAKHPELYQTARRSPLSLSYYAFCIENGSYNVKLHFAEIQFSDKEPYSGLAERVFNIYVQGKLLWEDFNIREEANGSYKEVIKEVNTNVTDNTLEIRLYWSGKGTMVIPNRGYYGSLISAISVCPSSESECGVSMQMIHVEKHSKTRKYNLIIGATSLILCILILCLGIVCWRRCVLDETKGGRGTFTLKQLKAATNNFNEANKLGEGGFGPVFKGKLSDGTMVAVKQLSSGSGQGNKEFVNEIGMIACLQHPNLVKLYGCCAEKNQLLLVYEYMENNCLSGALFGKNSQRLDWKTRQKICVGIAKGLVFLHEESTVKIIHRDIKGTNVLLDKELNAKISDFGLARLHEDEKSHISTRIAGTIGYMAPEYALRGYLTDKADVYSFGIVAMEIVRGKSNANYSPESDSCVGLLDWAFLLHKKGDYEGIVDPKLEDNFDVAEVERMVKVGLLCTSNSPTLRPSMSEVVKMLEGETEIEQSILEPNAYGDDLVFKQTSETGTSSLPSDYVMSGSSPSPWAYDLDLPSPEYVVLDSSIFSSSSLHFH